MSVTGLTSFDSTVQTTNVWLHDFMERLGLQDRNRAYHAFRAVLHALRDRLTIEQVAALGAQLPMLMRGFYYEGWHPGGKPVKERKKEEFLAHVEKELKNDFDVDPELIVRGVFQVLIEHVSPGEIETVQHLLPEEIRSLWVDERTVWF
jgi:uncharacterized protein (DUF2267 family)